MHLKPTSWHLFTSTKLPYLIFIVCDGSRYASIVACFMSSFIDCSNLIDLFRRRKLATTRPAHPPRQRECINLTMIFLRRNAKADDQQRLAIFDHPLNQSFLGAFTDTGVLIGLEQAPFK